MINKQITCITKTSKGYLKHHLNSLKAFARFVAFLDKNHEWHYINIYERESRKQIYSFTKNNRFLKETV